MPFTVELNELQLQFAGMRGEEHGIRRLEVWETPTLRQLHDRLNRELAARFGDTRAAYDGPDYHFHMTVMMGGAGGSQARGHPAPLAMGKRGE